MRDRQSITTPPSPEDLKHADFMMLLLSQPETNALLSGHTVPRKSPPLAALAPFLVHGIWYTRGRFGQVLKHLLGPDKLAILAPTSRLAQIYMIQGHRENHGGAGDTLFRSRPYAWIVRGRNLAEKVVRSCNWCQGRTKSLLRQQISDLPDVRTNLPCKPWTCTAIDLLGAYEVRAMNNARSKLRAYPIVFCCLNLRTPTGLMPS